jgi:release factor glutamine methyltransferase
MLTISELLRKTTGYLKDKGSSSPRLDAEVLMTEVLGLSRVELYTNYEQPLTPPEVDRYRELIRRRSVGEPVAYILGRAPFRNLTLSVDRNVLIPRPETEQVVDIAVQYLMEGNWPTPPIVLDLGTGSGAIAISIARGFPEARVTATDASANAMELARENARTAGAADRIEFVHSDMFDALDPLTTFDLIVSNPPYVSEEEWETLAPDVRDYEPREALFGGIDGLDYLRRLAVEAPQFLKPHGALVMEIGHLQGPAVLELMHASDLYRAVRVGQDYAGHDRIVVGQRK